VTGHILVTTSKYFYSYLSQNIDNMNKNIKVVIFQAPFPTCLKKVLTIYATYIQYDIMIWHVHTTIVAVEMQQCILLFFPHYVINNMVFGKH
jgi:hypothetical protein